MAKDREFTAKEMGSLQKISKCGLLMVIGGLTLWTGLMAFGQDTLAGVIAAVITIPGVILMFVPGLLAEQYNRRHKLKVEDPLDSIFPEPGQDSDPPKPPRE